VKTVPVSAASARDIKEFTVIPVPLGQVVRTREPPLPSSIIWYRLEEPPVSIDVKNVFYVFLFRARFLRFFNVFYF